MRTGHSALQERRDLMPVYPSAEGRALVEALATVGDDIGVEENIADTVEVWASSNSSQRCSLVWGPRGEDYQIKHKEGAIVLGSAAACFSGKFLSLSLRVTIFTSFSCTVHVNPPHTCTAYYSQCWKGPSY